MSLTDKIVLVTGACSGIGRAVSEELLKNGVKILIPVDIHQAEPDVVTGWRKDYPNLCIKYMSVDVSIAEHIKRCYQAIGKDIGTLDIVINCAGIMDQSDITRIVNINLTGVMVSTMQAVEIMRKDTGKGDGGIIINIASIVGLSPASFLPMYSATKEGVVCFNRAMAHGHDVLGIRFVTICPGFTDTALYAESTTKPGFYFMYNFEDRPKIRAKFKRQTPEQVSSGIMKLIQEAKNGSVWIIDGGECKEEVFPQLDY
ncbi:hypothetical protein DMENIID0001_069470 [Sergentomyia squamirostris]